jgi:hypothetical protein
MDAAIVRVITDAIAEQIARPGLVRMNVLPQSEEQLALDIIDALQGAGFTIVAATDA